MATATEAAPATAAAAAAAGAAVGAAPAANGAAPAAAERPPPPPYADAAALDAHVRRAWAHFRSLGSPRLHVAPMVDASELPFRLLCRAHGAEAAYTPMLHARLFLELKGYRAEHFTTCAEDRPLFAQFCANDPDTLVRAAELVQDHCDYVDLNLGCPQRIAKKGYYGAFLMDNLPLVEALVTRAAASLRVPVSCKIRLFPDLGATIEYARMLERAGCSLLAVHGRTRDMKNTAQHRADWAAMAAVRAAVRVPVLVNGDVRCLADAERLIEATRADGVMSADPLLHYPALFDPAMQAPLFAPPADGGAAGGEGGAEAGAGPGQQQQQQQQQEQGQGQQQQQQLASEAEAAAAAGNPSHVAHLERLRLCREYAELCAQHPVVPRMVKGHVHKLVQGWLAEFTDLRDRLNTNGCSTPAALLDLVSELERRVAAAGRAVPAPRPCDRKALQAAREAARAAAIEEQEREAAALAEIEGGRGGGAGGGGGGGGSEDGVGSGAPVAKRPCVSQPPAEALQEEQQKQMQQQQHQQPEAAVLAAR
ncbi:tRNA-dihydrouridine(16 17) synthase [NAD(P)(+)]-like [Raphidocelis subcapitata]|uniref:tRNA-dihydrouridine(16/17) synthase [NAD(P)(+)] n=1 Tax=Raphidocelis subcapitata TaxID=307507 RepID=A0A2V0NYJ5_9CHLO|nr:tRNA-dihydrouridine(16 17) synthase [NAD(P)(+)]-like [Raphidocelis subcapitata]|eukprot:GBF92704.1 tRNA-dihydrouridine(16 17) synthase [NAD(P)(+)]-like [Raphidocelis subcapitata]